jgi:hypothetical protein
MDKLTVKQCKFIKHYIKTGNGSESARVAGYKNRHSAYETLTNPHIISLFEELMEKEGITDKKLIALIFEGLNATKVISAQVIINTNKAGSLEKAEPQVKEKIADEKTTDFIDVPDFAVRHRYIETALRLKGRLKDILNIDNSRNIMNITVHKVDLEERIKVLGANRIENLV